MPLIHHGPPRRTAFPPRKGLSLSRCPPLTTITRFTPLQSEVGKGLLRFCGRQDDDLSSMVVVDSSGQHFLKSDAALRIAREIAPFPFLGKAVEALGSFLIPRLARDGLYDQVADNRYSILGKRECRITDPEEDDRFL